MMLLLLCSLLFSPLSHSAEQAREKDCAECGKAGASKFRYEGRDNVIGLMINDMNATDNKLKPADQIEKYHRCLLSDKSERAQGKSYDELYKYQIAVATENFNVPVGMLTCLCGRESRFDAHSANDESSARGICQAMSESLADVKKWITVNPEIKAKWTAYVARLGKRLEHADCATSPLSAEVLMRCPSLGLGVASVYLTYVYSRVEKGSAKDDWNAQGLNTLVAVAGSYFAGPGFASRALKKGSGRGRWPAALMESQCEYAKEKKKTQAWVNTRLNTLRNHMVSIRNCVQADNWLDHQGKPMHGECESPGHANQLKELEKFRASLPMSCPLEKASGTPAK
jgi:hypothetical protein